MSENIGITGLHQRMKRYLDEDELKILCHYIADSADSCKDLEPTALEGAGIANKAMSLIQYCRKHHALTALIENLLELRPDVLGEDETIWLDWANGVETTDIQTEENNRITAVALHRQLEELRNQFYTAEDAKDWQLVTDIGERILKLDEDDHETRTKMVTAYKQLGRASYSEGHQIVAFHFFNSAFVLEPEDAESNYLLGGLYYYSAQYGDALGYYEYALQYDKTNAIYHYAHGLAQQQLNNNALAIEDFHHALNIEPGNVDYLVARSYSYHNIGNHVREFDDLEAALRQQPNDPHLFYKYAMAHELDGRRDEAMRLFAMYPEFQTVEGLILRWYNLTMRKHYSPEFKAKLVQAMLTEQKTANQLAAEHGVHPTQLYAWRATALAGLPSLFSDQQAQEQAAKDATQERLVQELYAEIGKLTTQLNWLKKKAAQFGE